MAFNVEEFRSRLNANKGLMRTNKFHIRIPVPQVLLGGAYNGTPVSRYMEFYIQDASMPGYDLVIGNVRRWSYGPNEARPYSGNVNAFQMTINVDGNGDTHELISRWISAIMPHDITRGISGSYTHGGGTNNQYLLTYKNRYATSIEVTAFREDGAPTMSFELIEAFPSNITPINVSWGDNNQIAQFQATFQYLDFTKTTNQTQQQNYVTSIDSDVLNGDT